MLLTVENGIKGGMLYAIHQYAKANSKYMKDYDTRKNSSYLTYWDINNFNGWRMSQKLAVDGFKWRKLLLRFDEEFIQNYGEGSTKDTFCKLMLIILKNYSRYTMIFNFNPQKRRLISVKNLCIICMTRITMSYTYEL